MLNLHKLLNLHDDDVGTDQNAIPPRFCVFFFFVAFKKNFDRLKKIRLAAAAKNFQMDNSGADRKKRDLSSPGASARSAELFCRREQNAMLSQAYQTLVGRYQL